MDSFTSKFHGRFYCFSTSINSLFSFGHSLSTTKIRYLSICQIKACMEAVDCQPDFCLDLFEPSGHGRRRRAIADQSDTNHTNGITEFAKFKENIEYSVMLPGDYDQMKYQDGDQCKNFALISGLLALLLTISTIMVNLKDFSCESDQFTIFFFVSFSVLFTCNENSKYESKNHRRLRSIKRLCRSSGASIIQIKNYK